MDVKLIDTGSVVAAKTVVVLELRVLGGASSRSLFEWIR